MCTALTALKLHILCNSSPNWLSGEWLELAMSFEALYPMGYKPLLPCSYHFAGTFAKACLHHSHLRSYSTSKYRRNLWAPKYQTAPWTATSMFTRTHTQGEPTFFAERFTGFSRSSAASVDSPAWKASEKKINEAEIFQTFLHTWEVVSTDNGNHKEGKNAQEFSRTSKPCSSHNIINREEVN